MTEQQLKQLFENNSDCYADTWKDGREGATIMAMTAERFIEIFYPLLASKPDESESYWRKRCEAAESIMAIMDNPKNKPDSDNIQFLLFKERADAWEKSKQPQPSTKTDETLDSEFMNRDEEDVFLNQIIKEIETSSRLHSRYLLRKLINTKPSTKTEPGMKWVLASERLPEIVETPYASGANILWDRGSNRIAFKFKGELLCGRYVQEKMGFNNVFVSGEMDRIITCADFESIEWLEEASPIDRDGEAVNFGIWLFSKSGMWFDEDYLLWNIPDYVNTNEWLEEYGQGFPEGQFRFTTDELFKVFKSLPLGG